MSGRSGEPNRRVVLHSTGLQQNKELAKDCIKVATSYEAQKYAYLKVDLPPTRINVY